MHPKSPALTIDGTVLKESGDFAILGVTFDSKMTFQKRLRSVSRAAPQRLVILRKTTALCGALPVPYVPVRVTRCAVIAHRFTYAPPRCRTSQYRQTFNPLSVSLWNDLSDPVFYGVGLAGFKSRANAFILA